MSQGTTSSYLKVSFFDTKLSALHAKTQKVILKTSDQID
jgi:hypothetical protein